MSDIFEHLKGKDERVRDNWTYILESLNSLDQNAFRGRQEKSKRILRDDGATYNIHSDTQTDTKTWELDLIPSLISSEKWGAIESGLQERAELFNLLLKDIYGQRTLVKTGIIPSNALFLHAGFIRPCSGIHLPGDHDLVVHATDLMRDSSGDYCVLSDRTQCPSGAGYALENRTVMSRVLPSMFRDSHVHRMSFFFQRLRAKLASLSPNQNQPRIVVLTPGAASETYFEHAFLANYLSLPLVQSGDLVVRDGIVWMKSVDGLSQVDVIWRRVDDWYCDPVELRSDSQLGVPNLLSVVRAGKVVVANPIGCGVVENPILLKYLPAISKALLGRELKLKSVDTYWGGDAKDADFIMQNYESLVIKPISRSSKIKSVKLADVSAEQRDKVLKEFSDNPASYVAQPVLEADELPTYTNGEITLKPALLRSFAVASEQSYVIMPGGLTRVSTDKDTFHISNQQGAQSKDTWIVASEPERTLSRSYAEFNATRATEAELVSLPSRVVENLFWMGRYAERAEASLRLLRTVFIMLNAEDEISPTCRRTLFIAVTNVTSTLPGFTQDDLSLFASPEEELMSVINDGTRPGSIRSNLDALIRCASESQELLSSDTLRVINDVRDELNLLEQSITDYQFSAPEEALDPLVTALMALSGLWHESMLRGVGWRFMEIGRRVERGLQTAVIIKSMFSHEHNEADQSMVIHSLLVSLEALMSYRRRYRAEKDIENCLDLVMLDRSNPRSLIYQFEMLVRNVRALPKAISNNHSLPPEARAVFEGVSQIKLTNLSELTAVKNGKREKLQEEMQQLMDILGSASQALADRYFDHRASNQQLVGTTWEN